MTPDKIERVGGLLVGLGFRVEEADYGTGLRVVHKGRRSAVQTPDALDPGYDAFWSRPEEEVAAEVANALDGV